MPHGSNTELSLEDMAACLEASDDYRVLRRLPQRRSISQPEGETRRGLFLDVETTGLNPAKDEVIELALVPFVYGVDGRIFEIGEAYVGRQQPSRPIPKEITALTGIDDAGVAGKVIDMEAVKALIAPAALVVAHNAAFDRRFAERLCDMFSTKAWACSMSEVDWVAQGHEGVKLAYLGMGAGFFYERHQALHDCLAALELLAGTMADGRPAFAQLLARARRPLFRIWAEHSPFELKDALKSRGYRWNGEGNVAPRAWYIDVEEADRARELEFLQKEIYQREVHPLVRMITAYDRYSDRI